MSSRWRESPAYTLGFRLAAWYAVLFVGSAAVITGLTYVLLANSLRQRDADLIRSTLFAYGQQYEQGGLVALDRAIRTDQAAGQHERLFVRVLSAGQEVIFYNLPGGTGEFDLSRLQQPAGQGGEWWAEVPRRGSSSTLEVVSAVLPGGALLQVGKSTDARDELLARFRTVMLLTLALIVLIGVAGGALLTRSTMQPLRQLAGVVETMLRTGRLEARVPVGGGRDPLDQLGVLFNAMLDRIGTLIAAMRGSLDNVAHDLRTPMARLRGIAERALEAENAPPDRYREALADCMEESDRVLGMLDTLMDISEAETGVMKLAPEPVEVDDLLRDALDLYSDVAEEKGVSVAVAAPSGLQARVDRKRIRQVVANLLDNAVKYTPDGGRVTMRARAEADEVVVEVSDTGPGIAPDDLPRIWDRLYRGDRSRSERGLGLGLSLVRAIVQAHGGRVEAKSPPGEGAVFTVWLPAQPRA